MSGREDKRESTCLLLGNPISGGRSWETFPKFCHIYTKMNKRDKNEEGQEFLGITVAQIHYTS